MKSKIAVFILLLILSPAAFSDSGTLVSREVAPGAVLSVILYQPARASVTFPGGGSSSAESFPMDVEGDGKTEHVLLLGIPCTVSPGIATMVLSSPDGLFETQETEVIILERDFLSETIPLTDSLVDLREDEKEARERESRILYDIFISFDPAAVYDPGPYGDPLSIEARVTSYFGDRRIYTNPSGWVSRSIHSGIDLAAPVGTAIYSSGSGRVVFSDVRIITGETVLVEHMPGVFCLYYHMDKRFVEAGDMIDRGALVGTVGKTGFATGAHLHWEFRVGGVPVDPDILVREGLLDKEAILSMISTLH